MDYQDLQKISDSLPSVISQLRELMDSVEKKDINLYRHFYMCWNKLCNVQSCVSSRLNSRPFCASFRNCPGWICGYGCVNCDYQPPK